MKSFFTYVVLIILFLTGNKLVATQQKYTDQIREIARPEPVINSSFWADRFGGDKSKISLLSNRLLESIKFLFFIEEPSYNFGGRYAKGGDVLLTIGVQDGSYWVKFAGKNEKNSSPCELSGKASVKNGTLRISCKQGKLPITLVISAADHTNKMVVRGLRKGDQYGLTHFCKDSVSLAGEYKRIP